MSYYKTYSELILLPTFEERYEYLQLNGVVGEETFGFDRYLNQLFYQRDEDWRFIRDKIILRDNGCDLGIEDREIVNMIYIHHMNPITKEDIINRSEFLLNPNYLICASRGTHNAIHYGDKNLLMKLPKKRFKNDTCPWKQERGE